MEKIIVRGGNRLNGELLVSGMKNSALPIIFSCILISGDCILDNIPRVKDVENAIELLNSMGARAEFCDKHSLLINTDMLSSNIGAEPIISKMRASSYLLGSLLSRFGVVNIPMPGGCNFGSRPLDLHLKGFRDLGASCLQYDDRISITTPQKLKCNKITLDKISVGATINMVLASVLLNGVTVIENCAMEPHVDDLITFLNKCGAKIFRSRRQIICCGVKKLFGTRYKIYPDMIEALTYISCIGICKGKVDVLGVIPGQISNELKLFEKMGYNLNVGENRVTVSAKIVKSQSVMTEPYPGFPTDLHPQFVSLLCFSDGGGSVKETVFPTRFAYVNELKKMGADICLKNDTVYVRKAPLVGATLDATDLRAGAALISAALGAEGISIINNVNHIVRGYESIVDKIACIGGNIKITKGE